MVNGGGRCGVGLSRCKLDAAGCEPLGGGGLTNVCFSGHKFQGDTLGNLLLVIHSYPTAIPCDPTMILRIEEVESAHSLTTLMTN